MAGEGVRTDRPESGPEALAEALKAYHRGTEVLFHAFDLT